MNIFEDDSSTLHHSPQHNNNIDSNDTLPSVSSSATFLYSVTSWWLKKKMTDRRRHGGRRRRRGDDTNATAAASAMGHLLLEALAASSTSLVRPRQDYGLGVSPPPPMGNPFYYNPQYNYDDDGAPPKAAVLGFFPWIRRTLWYCFVGTLLLLSSLCLYGVFYKLVMPGLHASEKLYFEYQDLSSRSRQQHFNGLQSWNTNTTTIDNNGQTMGSTTNEFCGNDDNNSSTTINGTCSRQETESSEERTVENDVHYNPPQVLHASQEGSPRAIADLFSRHDQWVAHHPDILPHPKSQTRILPSRVAHYLEILLDLPESERNKHAGVFGVMVDLQSSNGTLLASSLRNARMPHESRWIAVVRKMVCIVPYLLGALQESRRVLVPSFRFFVESEQLPLRYVTISLIMAPEKAEKGEILEVLQGQLHIGKELTDFQLLLKEYFFTSMVFGTIFFYGLQVLLLLSLQAYWAILEERRAREQDMMEDDASNDLDLDEVSLRDGGDNSGGGVPTSHDPTEEGVDRDTRQSVEDVTNLEGDADATFFECDGRFEDGHEGEWEDLPTGTTTANPSNGQQTHSGVNRIPDYT